MSNVYVLLEHDLENINAVVCGVHSHDDTAKAQFEEARKLALQDNNCLVLEDQPGLLSLEDSNYHDATGYVLEILEVPYTKRHPGKLHPPDTLFLRMEVGTATDPETGTEYELSLNLAGDHPIISSSKTGKWWTINWADLIKLALEAGIDEEETDDGQ